MAVLVRSSTPGKVDQGEMISPEMLDEDEIYIHLKVYSVVRKNN